MKKLKKIDIGILYSILTLMYGALIYYNTDYFNPVDEMSIPEAYRCNRWYGIEPWQFKNGRFHILNGLDVFILKKYFSLNEISYYYLISSLEFIFTAFVVYKLLKLLKKDQLETFTYVFILLLCPGFTSIYFRLLYPERYVLLISFLIVYWLIQIFYFNKQKIKYFIFIAILTNICMYFKESAFCLFFSLGIGLLIINFKNKIKSKYIFFLGIVMIVSVLIYLILYYYFIIPEINTRYGYNTMSFSKNLVLTSIAWIINDPIIMLLFIPVEMCNLHSLIKNKFNDFSIIHVFGFAGLLYVLSFFILKLYSYHYFIPVYAFALPVLIYSFNKYRFTQKMFIICFIIQLGNITVGVNDILFQKYEHKNFNIIVNELDDICKINFKVNHTKTNIYVLGGQYFNNNMFFLIMNQLFEKGNNTGMFDIMSFEKNIDSHNQKKKSTLNSPFRFMNQDIVDIPKPGDYILYTPYTRLNKLDLAQLHLSTVKSLIAPSYLEKFNFLYVAKLVLHCIDKNSTIESNSVRNGSYILYIVN